MEMVLVIIPNSDLRERTRELLGGVRSLRARDCEQGLVLAEQNIITDVIVWSEPGLDGKVVHAILRLQQLHRDARIFVVTPERLKAARLGYCEGLKVEGFALESELERVVQDVRAVPSIVDSGNSAPPTATGGSSAACH
jgi:hypothetical protein